MDFKLTCNDDGVFVSFDQDNKSYMFDVYPLDLKKSEPPRELTILTSECLKKQLEERATRTTPRYLLGECHKNARNLFEYLCGYQYNPKLIIGCNLAAGGAVGVERSFKDVKNVHQWVEVDQYVAEVCSEANNSVGKLYISRNKPSNYKSYITLDKNQVRSLPTRYITTDNIDSVLRCLED